MKLNLTEMLNRQGLVFQNLFSIVHLQSNEISDCLSKPRPIPFHAESLDSVVFRYFRIVSGNFSRTRSKSRKLFERIHRLASVYSSDKPQCHSNTSLSKELEFVLDYHSIGLEHRTRVFVDCQPTMSKHRNYTIPVERIYLCREKRNDLWLPMVCR